MMDLSVAYEDESLLIVDKPQGLATAPGKSPSLCEEVFRARPELAAVSGYKAGEGGLLNRLDNDTGGLVLFAKTDEAFRFYERETKEGRVAKTYLAVVHGAPERAAGRIEAPIGHSAKSARRMVPAGGKQAVRGRARKADTSYRLIESRPPFALLEVDIERGARHQIRVHLAAVGLPIVGDRLYNKKGSAGLTERHLLSCCQVRFRTMAGEEKSVVVPAPFRETWRGLSVAG
jgi:23S rRNA pseudouridine1911/1915/1917 synthase